MNKEALNAGALIVKEMRMMCRELHFDSLVVDSHIDSIVAHMRRQQSFSDVSQASRSQYEGIVSHLSGFRRGESDSGEVQVNLKKMQAGGIDAAYFAIDVTAAWKNHLNYGLDAIGFFYQELEDMADEMVMARTAQDLKRAKEQGLLAAVLCIENSDVLEGSMNTLKVLYELGIRLITISHHVRSLAADGQAETISGGGLTTFGRDLVSEMNRLGMLIDVSHLSERSFWDVISETSQPVIASHSCCRSLCNHLRNLTDEQLRAVASSNGVVGITFVPDFVSEKPEGSLQELIAHIEHAVDVAGIDHVGIGSDFDGGGVWLSDATELPALTEELVKRGYKDDAVKKILGLNHLRVFREVCG